MHVRATVIMTANALVTLSALNGQFAVTSQCLAVKAEEVAEKIIAMTQAYE